MVLPQTICMMLPSVSPVIRGERQQTTVGCVLYTQLPHEIYNTFSLMKLVCMQDCQILQFLRRLSTLRHYPLKLHLVSHGLVPHLVLHGLQLPIWVP